MKNFYESLLFELTSGHQFVLGTLIKTKGSTPQVPGASAVFNSSGLVFGTLGGGLLEALATQKAKEIAGSRQSVVEKVELNGALNDQTGAICGGSAVFLLDANPRQSLPIFTEVGRSLKKGQAGNLVTIILPGNNQAPLITRHWIPENEPIPSFLKNDYLLNEEVIKGISKTRKAQVLTRESESDQEILVFIEPLFPNPQLIVVGAGHIGQSLCHLANYLGFDVTLVDNRSELATKERFPETQRMIIARLADAFQEISISSNTYIVIVTQGHRTDTEALAACIQSNAKYIGMIGSKRKVSLIRKHLIEEGICTASQFDRVHAPIGINIHSKTVPEIALSIAAQLVETRNSPNQSEDAGLIWSVVLAAGQSIRMNQQKLLMPWQGKSIVQSVVEKSMASKVSQTLVVVGSHKSSIEKQLDSFPVSIAENPNYREGMLSSVQCGMQAVPGHVGAIVLLLGDQPMVQAQVINQLIDAWKATDKGLVVPIYSGKRGHPLLIDLKFRSEIDQLNPTIGLRELLQNHPEEILEVEVSSDDVLKDIDTPEDYQKEMNQQI